ncbi:NUDIX hydrolase [Leptolyngbya sp. 15MV]|nr:NUDIX hydrolase [Leptolyngbya sp. 15MV]
MPTIRCDLVDVYVIRQFEGEWLHRADTRIEFLQLCRAVEPARNTWQPVMGHIEHGETAIGAAIRELREEVGLKPSDKAFKGMWQLEQVHPFFLASQDAIVLSPRFVVEVSPEFGPRLNQEHDGWRWIASHQAMRYFMWPGQLQAVREIVDVVFRPGSITRDALRVC